ncbi:hypothetical protein K440DRAFT_589525 [Wilcoxina mikolae CBS 423.85]|nr:hypothetical protein K440DRAFT_589525 [Wilcoxina mikolae CBS 423.85]
MFFFFTCGSQDLSSGLSGYEQLRVVCPNCHNASVTPIKRRTFFTFCFIPIFPIAWGKELRCSICNYHQSTTTEQLNQMAHQAPPAVGK